MQDKYATTTLRIAEHRQENMAKPEGLKHTKLLALLERPTLASRVPLFLLGHFLTNECEISDCCL